MYVLEDGFAYHLQCFLLPEQIEHGLQMLLDVAALVVRLSARAAGPLSLGRQHQGRGLARKVTFAEAKKQFKKNYQKRSRFKLLK